MIAERSPSEVEKKLDEDGLQVVDIRPSTAFKQGHIPGAINIPLGELPSRVDEYEWDKEVVFVCPVGQSSLQAARLLRSFEGVDGDTTIASMTGGYEQWDFELETSSGNTKDPPR